MRQFCFDDVATRVKRGLKHGIRLHGLYCMDYIDGYTCIIRDIFYMKYQFSKNQYNPKNIKINKRKRKPCNTAATG